MQESLNSHLARLAAHLDSATSPVPSGPKRDTGHMVLHQLKEGPLPVEKPTCGHSWASLPNENSPRNSVVGCTMLDLRAPGTRLVMTDYSPTRLLRIYALDTQFGPGTTGDTKAVLTRPSA
jgi:hypothetical protein